MLLRYKWKYLIIALILIFSSINIRHFFNQRLILLVHIIEDLFNHALTTLRNATFMSIFMLSCLAIDHMVFTHAMVDGLQTSLMSAIP